MGGDTKSWNPAVRAARTAYRMRRSAATVFAVLIALALGYHAIFGHDGITAYAGKRSEGRRLDLRIQELEEENARLKDHVDHLKTDADAVEHEARERLHYARPGEVIYTFNDPTSSDAPRGSGAGSGPGTSGTVNAGPAH